MSNRHLARSLALQSLYEWDFHQAEPERATQNMERNLAEFAPDLDEKDFGLALVKGVIGHRADIDATIVKFAPDWPLERITTADRNVLRIGAYELLFDPQIPSKVAINEAIELAKTFGGESSGKFVNGVLGAIFRDQIAQGAVKEVDKPKQEETKNEEGSKRKEEPAFAKASAGESGKEGDGKS